MAISFRIPGMRPKNMQMNVRGHLHITIFFLLVIAGTSLFAYFAFRKTVIQLSRVAEQKSATIVQSSTATAANSTNSSSKTKLPLLVQEYGLYYPEPRAQNFPTSFHEGQTVTSGNSGNYLWQYASTRLLDLTSVRYCANSRETCIQNEMNSGFAVDKVVHLHPCANLLVDAINVYRKFTRVYLQKITKRLREWAGEPYFLLGAGSQGEFSQNLSHRDLGALERPEYPAAAFKTIEEGQELLKTMEAAGWPAFFRGGYTNTIAKNAGFSHGFETGCPTFMLHTSARLGQDILQRKYDELGNRIGDRSLKLAINIVNGRHQPRLIAFLLQIVKNYPNSLVFAQGVGDLAVLRQNDIPISRVRFFPKDTEGWIHALSKMDASFGCRIHGNMAALAAGIPVFVIAPDFRVKELVEVMKLPHTDVYDQRLVAMQQDPDIATLFRQVKFDGHSFDQGRCFIARRYEQEFRHVGVNVAPHVKLLSQTC